MYCHYLRQVKILPTFIKDTHLLSYPFWPAYFTVGQPLIIIMYLHSRADRVECVFNWFNMLTNRFCRCLIFGSLSKIKIADSNMLLTNCFDSCWPNSVLVEPQMGSDPVCCKLQVLSPLQILGKCELHLWSQPFLIKVPFCATCYSLLDRS